MESASQQQANSTKRVPGRPFKPGTSGNPHGRPPKDARLRELEKITRAEAQAALERLAGPALKVLQKALAGKDQALAVRAAVDVLDRAVGKAIQRIDANVNSITETRTLSAADITEAARVYVLRQQAALAVEVDPEEQQP